MTRDEIIDQLSEFLDAQGVAQQICHDGFDSFVHTMRDRAYGGDTLVDAWTWFREGWDAQT